ncbi:MAG: hydrogenase [Clostridiaceae bacterium]
MVEILISFILMTGIAMSGFRRASLLNRGFALQSLIIALICLIKGNATGEYHYYILFFLTIITKVIFIPMIINRSIKDTKMKRETDLILSGHLSYIISGMAVALCFIFLGDFADNLFKAGCVLIITGALLLIGRRKAITQMIGLLTIENGVVLFEISMIKMGSIIEFGIVFEMLILAMVMGVMIFRINKTFDTINTDYLSNLKE